MASLAYDEVNKGQEAKTYEITTTGASHTRFEMVDGKETPVEYSDDPTKGKTTISLVQADVAKYAHMGLKLLEDIEAFVIGAFGGKEAVTASDQPKTADDNAPAKETPKDGQDDTTNKPKGKSKAT